jgi:hypothetical protein
MRGQRRRAWQVRRTSVPTPTGQQRWAYQLLLQWTMTSPEPTEAPGSPNLPEVSHASSDLQPRLDQPPGRPPDH